MTKTIVCHDLRKKYHISILEYCFLEELRFPHTPKTKEEWASFLNISRATVFRMIASLRDKRLLQKKNLLPSKLWSKEIQSFFPISF